VTFAITDLSGIRTIEIGLGMSELPDAMVVERIAKAAGTLGTNRYYLFKLVEHLDALGVADGPLHALARRVREKAGEVPAG